MWFAVKGFGVALLLVAAAVFAGLAIGAESRLPERFDTVVIDAGHGGDDDGARSLGGLLEKDLVLDVARRVAESLRGQGLRVVLTRTEDIFVPLERRTAIANDARADLFVSIHANATHDAEVRGVETFFMSLDASDDHARRVAQRENEAFGGVAGPAKHIADPLIAIIGDLIATEHMEESNEFARLAQAALTGGLKHGRGVKQAHFVVLEGVQMPASLVEIGFLTNAQDEKQLQGSTRRAQIASALVRATLEFGQRYDTRRGAAANR